MHMYQLEFPLKPIFSIDSLIANETVDSYHMTLSANSDWINLESD